MALWASFLWLANGHNASTQVIRQYLSVTGIHKHMRRHVRVAIGMQLGT